MTRSSMMKLTKLDSKMTGSSAKDSKISNSFIDLDETAIDGQLNIHGFSEDLFKPGKDRGNAAILPLKSNASLRHS